MILAKQSLPVSQAPLPFIGPVEIKLIEGQGRGLVTTQDVVAGQVLIVAHAFSVGNCSTLIPNTLESVRDATPRLRDQFLSLYDGGNGGELPPSDLFCADVPCPDPYVARISRVRAPRIRKIVELNSQDLTDLHTCIGGKGDHMCLWLLPSFMNHSCEPSAFVIHAGTDVAIFKAARDLRRGDEVTDTYVNLLEPMLQRQEGLVTQKGFRCTCARCVLEAAALDERVVQRIFTSIPGEAQLADPVRAIAKLRPLAIEAQALFDVACATPALRACLLQVFAHLADSLARIASLEAPDAYQPVVAILAAAMPGSAYHVEFAIGTVRAWAQRVGLPDSELVLSLRRLRSADQLRFGDGSSGFRDRVSDRLQPPLLEAALGLGFSLRLAPCGQGGELLLHLPLEVTGSDVELLVSDSGARAHLVSSTEAAGAAWKQYATLEFPRHLHEVGKARYRRREHLVSVLLVG